MPNLFKLFNIVLFNLGLCTDNHFVLIRVYDCDLQEQIEPKFPVILKNELQNHSNKHNLVIKFIKKDKQPNIKLLEKILDFKITKQDL